MVACLGERAPRIDASYVGAAVIALCAGLTLWWAAPGIYDFLFGPVPAPVVIPFGIGAGAVALLAIRRHHRSTNPGWRGLALIASAGLTWSAVPIAIDLFCPFGADINVTLPAALLFYPVMAVLAEALLHLVPLAVAVALVGKGRVASTLPLVAVLEPLFQTLLNTGPGLREGATALHIYLFNLLQLHLFWRFGFGAMITLRLGFYLGWHILWGQARLGLLFA